MRKRQAITTNEVRRWEACKLGVRHCVLEWSCFFQAFARCIHILLIGFCTWVFACFSRIAFMRGRKCKEEQRNKGKEGKWVVTGRKWLQDWYIYWAKRGFAIPDGRDLRRMSKGGERQRRRGCKGSGYLLWDLFPFLSIPKVQNWFHLKHLKCPRGSLLGSVINIKIALELFLNWMQSAKAVSHHFIFFSPLIFASTRCQPLFVSSK